MRDRTRRLILDIIEREGDYVDNKADRGGPTKYGITQKTLSSWLGKPATKADVQNLTKPIAFQIYWRRYVRKPNFDCIHYDSVAEHVCDCGVLHGTKRAAEWLQEAAGVTVDGIVGSETLKAVNEGTRLPEELNRAILKKRLRFMATIVRNDHTQAKFILGWVNRALEFLE